MAIYRGAGGAGDATADSISEASLIKQLAVEVQADADAAEAARAAAVTAKVAAETAETNAETAETNAETAETNAETAASSATSSKNAAATSATNAANSASAAATSASNAASSASSASSSATSAASSATSATSSKNAAASSATAAATSATNASNSATNAAASATAAAASYDNFDDRYLGSKTSAPTLDNDGNALITGALYFNSTAGDMFVWNGSAWVTVSNTTSSTNAANSAAAAAVSEANAAASASSASTSATTATTQAGIATTQATNAANSATAAATSATNAANSATSASTSATNAASSATSASSSATSAATSAAQASAVALGNEPVRHSVRPSLLLDFANTKTLDPRITFTRGSTATFYNGRTVAKAEENQYLYSQDIDNAFWQKVFVSVTANSVTAPDGTTTAETITADGTSNGHYIAGADIAGAKLISVFAKAGTGNFIQIAVGGTATPYANFDLSGGTTNAYGTGTTSSITPVGNGWYRCVMYTDNAVAKDNRIAIVTSLTAARLESNTSTSTVHLWGIQAEARSSVTAYTATTTAPITNYIPALQTAAANVARFEHNPVTGESLGLEIEEQRTNLLTYSEQFNDAAWSKTRASIDSNTIVAPDGTLTGDKLVASTDASTTHFIQNNATTTATSHTFTVYVKPAGYNFVYLLNATASLGAYFDLVNTTIGTVSSGVTASITDVGNGWRRCSMTATATAATNGFRIYPAISTSSGSFTGDGYSGIYIWGAQLEAGSFATSYIPTVASQVTRSADSASMTGANFSSWYRADEGTLYGEASVIGATTDAVLASINNSSTTNDMRLRVLSASSSLGFRVFDSGVSQASLTQASAFTVGNTFKMSGAYKVNDFAFSANSTTATTDTSGTIPSTVDVFSIGRVASTGFLNGTIKKLAYYPKRLTNAELQGLTTV